MKVCVYAITKNESKFVDRWYESMREADSIVVLDTGSIDDTVEKLRAHGVKVEVKRYCNWDSLDEYEWIKSRGGEPWRFDVARNDSMKLIPEDTSICVCTDLDEVLLPGWRVKLENAWTAALARGIKPTTATYEYVWSFNRDGTDGSKFTYEKVHAPGVCRWEHPVHEILEYDCRKVSIPVDGMRLEHRADPCKSRGQYLKLLELSVKECPDDDRNVHYLGREYMFHERWEDAIRTLQRHLSMPSATWRAERASSMRFIAKCYGAMGDEIRQELYLWQAMSEAPEQREAALELAELVYDQICNERDVAKRNYQKLVRVCEILLSRKDRVMSYLTKAEAWGSKPYDLYSIGLWYTGHEARAIDAIRDALALSPDNERLKNNLRVMSKNLKFAH